MKVVEVHVVGAPAPKVAFETRDDLATGSFPGGSQKTPVLLVMTTSRPREPRALPMNSSDFHRSSSRLYRRTYPVTLTRETT